MGSVSADSADDRVEMSSSKKNVGNVPRRIHKAVRQAAATTISSGETGDTLEPFLFMPFIRRCSFQSSRRFRVLAARALKGLAAANEKLLNIASELARERSHSSFNSIHGMLLQLNSLLDTNCLNLSDPSKKDAILHELIQILATRSWIGRPRQFPCPVLNGCIVYVSQVSQEVKSGSRSENASPFLTPGLCLDLASVYWP